MAILNKIKINDLDGLSFRLDAEYYQPYFIDLTKSISKVKNNLLKQIADVTDGSHEIRSYTEEGVLFLRVQDIFEEGLIIKDPVFISFDEDRILARSKPKKGDLLVTKTGKIGTSIVYSEIWPDCNLPADIALIKIKNKSISPYYLATYLNSSYGQSLLKREMTGSGRPRLVLDNFPKLLIPIISKRVENEIEHLVKDCYKLNILSQKLYPEAEQELLERMEWNEVKTEHILSYGVTSKEIMNDERLDPEFYQPKFKNIEKYLRKIEAVPLGEFCPMPNRGVQPQYDENGEVLVINSKHINATEIDIDNAEKTTEVFFSDEINKKAQIEKQDVLMYSTGAYVGRTNTYLYDKKALASNHVTIMRPDKKVCNPVYLALFLNSEVGLMQTDQRASGSAQREIYPQEIAKYQIFIPHERSGKPDLEWQKKIADKVIAAYETKKSAKQKLQEAQELVEKEIKKLINK